MGKMKKSIHFSFLALIGILLVAAGLIGLYSAPKLSQYAFLPAAEKTEETLERLDALQENLRESFPLITIHGQKSGVTLTAGTVSRNEVCLYLTGPGWHEVYPRRYLSGRPISRLDVENGSRVIVLDQETAFRLFSTDDAAGKKVTVDGTELEVIGVCVHSRRIGETGENAAWVPLGVIGSPELMTVTVPSAGGSSLMTVFQTAAREAFGAGTLISLRKETMRQTILLRTVLLILAVWLLLGWMKIHNRLWRGTVGKIRTEREKRYPGSLIPYAAVRLLPVMAMTVATVAVGYLLAVVAVSPAYTFPEWIPESLGDLSKWVSRFWNLTGESARAVTLKTPELAEIRFFGGMVRWGTVLALLGNLMTATRGRKTDR